MGRHIEARYRKFHETGGKESYPVRLVHVKQHLPALVVKNFSVFQYGKGAINLLS